MSMTGEYNHILDTKGRIFIPSKLRESLGDSFYLTISADKCLNAYSADDWQILTDKVNAMSYIKQRKMRPLFSCAAKCDMDSQGRVLIPQNLRAYAGIKKDVTIIGCNNHAELWDSSSWVSVYKNETTVENLTAVMEELDF